MHCAVPALIEFCNNSKLCQKYSKHEVGASTNVGLLNLKCEFLCKDKIQEMTSVRASTGNIMHVHNLTVTSCSMKTNGDC